MIELKEFKAYIQGDEDSKIKDLLNTHVLEYGVPYTRVKYQDGYLPLFRINEKLFSDIQKHKQDYTYHIFIIKPGVDNSSVIADIIDSCYTNPKRTLILIHTHKEENRFSRSEMKELYKVIDLAMSITNREIAILNDIYSVLFFIEETTGKEFNCPNEHIVNNTMTTVNSVYKELQDKLPSHVFLNRSKIDNIARIVYTYISQNIAKKV
jgi:hypothetical protein